MSEPELEVEKEPGYEFGEDFQKKIVALALRDTVFATRTQGLISPAYFDNDVDAALVSVAVSHYEIYKQAPDRSTIAHVLKKAIVEKRIRHDLIPGIKARIGELMKMSLSDRDLVIDEVADFAKNRAIEKAIMQSAELVGKKDYAKIRKLMDDALVVGVTQDGGSYDYWNEIEHRTAERKDILAGIIKKDGITSGLVEFDKYLYHHGWGRKELTVIMGAAKAGKSMSLGDFAKNASLAGYTVLYASCEVSAKIIANRTDANVSDIAIKLVGDSPIKVEELIKKAGLKAGPLYFEEFPSGALKVSELKRLLERYRQRGISFDLIVVDYADIMAPERHNNETRDGLNQIYLDLRGVAFIYNAAVLTATQTNREGAKSVVAKAKDVAEDFNKVRTADLLLSINSTDAERLAGEARIFFAASRNSEDGFILRISQDRAKMQFMKKVLGKELA